MPIELHLAPCHSRSSFARSIPDVPLRPGFFPLHSAPAVSSANERAQVKNAFDALRFRSRLTRLHTGPPSWAAETPGYCRP